MIYRYTKTRRQRFIDFLWLILGGSWKPAIKLLGAILIYVALVTHFNIKFTCLEALCLGVGLGLFID